MSALIAVHGFPASGGASAVQYKIVSSAGATVQDWTATGVQESVEGGGKSTYYLVSSDIAGGEYLVHWRYAEDGATWDKFAVEALSRYQTDALLRTVIDGEAIYGILSALLAAAAGEVSASGQTVTVTTPDGNTTRIQGTVDANGNRADITLSAAEL